MNKNLLFKFLTLLPENPSDSELEKGYKALAQFFHPDRNPNRKDWAEEMMKQLNEAREVLANPLKRSRYIQIFKESQSHQDIQSNHLQRLRAENLHLKRAVRSRNQANGVLGLALLLLGGAMLLDS
ncbi:MAG: hypothetical protein CMN32_16215 [Saprospirales bacterium]|nr:hypothetical protein [Saprospirales bacterium]